MAIRPWVVRLFSATGCALALGCALADLLTPSQLEDVTLTFVGSTDLQVGVRTPFSIQVEAAGEMVPSPRFRFLIGDTSNVALTPTLDTLVGRKVGQTTLTAELESSILTDSAPTLITTLKVLGGPPAGTALGPQR